MLTRSLLLRIAAPTLFVSLLFLGSCLAAALYLPPSIRMERKRRADATELIDFLGLGR